MFHLGSKQWHFNFHSRILTYLVICHFFSPSTQIQVGYVIGNDITALPGTVGSMIFVGVEGGGDSFIAAMSLLLAVLV